MKNEDFYEILDGELEAIIASAPSDGEFSRLGQEAQKKSRAFLHWFLRFYAGIEDVDDYITDGHGDNSCDIILDIIDKSGKKTFYIVQSKWNSRDGCGGAFDSKELKAFFSDVQSVIRGDKEESKNERFNSRYRDLLRHVKENGSVKIIYLCLKNNCKDAAANTESLRRALGGDISVDGFDINRIKKDFININFKKSSPPNPLENIYSPEFEEVPIEIVREDGNDAHIRMGAPFEAHVFLVRPSLVHRLVERYGVSLFEKNVRNPLSASAINAEIKNSLVNNPSYFWYYNNGITAITRKIPQIGNAAEKFEVLGLQIINGAQTAYSIYQAYSECSHAQRDIIDSEARITFRLLKSGGKDFDLKVTKFTNSQNPVSDRDFWSGDEVQERIQDYFYNTPVWYERRDGEFRRHPEGVVVVPNQFMANAYLAFYLKDPVAVTKGAFNRDSKNFDSIFTSHKENPDGQYERIFNKNSNPKDFFAAFCIFDILTDREGFNVEGIFFTNGFHVLALTRVVLEKYIRLKYGESADISEFVIKNYAREKRDILHKAISYAGRFATKKITDSDGNHVRSEIVRFMTKESYFGSLLEEMEAANITTDELDAMPIGELINAGLSDDEMDDASQSDIGGTVH